MSDKKLTEEDLKKAVQEAYELGRKHERDSAPMPSSLAGSKLALEVLSKTIDDNSKKINEQILARHRENVSKHMDAWKKDASKALDELIALAEHKHGKKTE